MVAFASTPAASAIDRRVPEDYPNIQSAINASVDGDVVLIAPGTYNETLSVSNKSIVIRGSGASQTKIDRQGGQGTVISISGSASQTVVVEKLWITRWYEYDRACTVSTSKLVFNSIRMTNGGGGVILSNGADFECHDSDWILVGTWNSSSPYSAINTSSGSALLVSNCSFQGCRGYYGGVIRGDSMESCSIVESRFTGCQSYYYGGVAYKSSNGPIAFTNCEFTGCNASVTSQGFGGLCYSDGAGSITFSECVASGMSSFREGAILWTNAGSVTLRDSAFRDGSTSSYSGDYAGGFVRFGSATLDVDGCTFENLNDNACYRWGGVIGTRSSGGNVLIRNSQFVNCRSSNECSGYWGRIIYVQARSLSVQDCTFQNSSTGYSTSSYGGAIAVDQGSYQIQNSDFFKQYAGNQGGAIFVSNATGVITGCTFDRCQNDSAVGFQQGNGGSWTVANCAFLGSSIRVYSGNRSLSVTGCSFVRDTSTGWNSSIIAPDLLPPFIDRCFFQNSGGGASVNVGSSSYAILNASSFCRPSSQEIATYFIEKEPCTFSADCVTDCDADGIPDDYAIGSGVDTDCNDNGIPDSCDFASGSAPDCDKDGEYDICQIAAGAPDCNLNGILDTCEPDCDADGVPNACEIASGASDCDANGIPDNCQPDCDSDATIDACEIAAGAVDCNANAVPDSCEIAAGTAPDLNTDAVIDTCQPEMQFAGLELEIVPIVNRGLDDLFPATSVCYRLYARTTQANSAVVGLFGNPDHPLAINATGGFWQSPYGGDLASAVPCDLSSALPSAKYDSWFTIGLTCALGNSVQNTGMNLGPFNKGGGVNDNDGIIFVNPGAPQSIAGPTKRVLLAQLTTRNAVLPTGTVDVIGRSAAGTSTWTAFSQAIPIPALVDCNANGVQDAFDIANATSYDCDQSGVPDTCEYGSASTDCNGNGIPDLCDVTSAFSPDQNGNFIPDECECTGDVDANGRVDVDDIIDVIAAWGTTGDHPADVNNDQVVDTADLVIVLSGYGVCL
jgi:hypothetical protein